MLISKIKNELVRNGQLSSRQLAFSLNEDINMIEAGLELLVSKKLIEKITTEEYICKNCAFKNSCSEENPRSHTLYKIKTV